MTDPGRAVFLSYASQDAEAARRIADALRAFGVEVWFDQAELRGGDAWDAKIRRQIHECALFLPVISATTQERGEGYFRREWHLAVERRHDMAEGVPFLVPVVIDGTRDTDAVVPEAFLHVQWTRLPQGSPTSQFVEQVKRLLEVPRRPAGGGGTAEGTRASLSRATQGDAERRKSKLGTRIWIVGAVIVIIAVIALITTRHAGPPERSEPASAQPPAALAASDKSLAVLPFKNLSDEKDAGFFADGVQEDILTNVQNVRELRVVSRQSVEQYRTTDKTMPQIGRELGVAYLVEGSVRKAGNKVRVSVQLIEARTDRHIWSPPPYDRDLNDIFVIQSEIAKAVAGELKAALSPQEKALIERRPTENLAAYDLYVKARDSSNREPFGQAANQKWESLLQSAVTLDPNFAAAWARLAGAHSGAYFLNYDHTEARRTKAKAAIDSAVRLAPDAPETLLALSGFSYAVLHDVEQRDRLFEQYAQVRPNDAEIFFNRGENRGNQGRWAESADSLRKATELDPGCYLYALLLRARFQECRRYDEAIEEQRRIVGLLPNSDTERQTLALLPFIARGSTREMDDWLAGLSEEKAKSRPITQIRKAWARARGDFAEAIRLDRVEKEPASFEAAVTLAASGDMAGACARLEDLPVKIRAQLVNDPDNADLLSQLGRMEALLGNKEEAVRCGRKAVELLPASLHRYWHAVHAYRLAVILAWTGDKDGAIDEFARLMRSEPTVIGMSVHHLKHGPWAWPLRDDPRWQALIDDPASNAPLF
jgi:TolB-like protein